MGEGWLVDEGCAGWCGYSQLIGEVHSGGGWKDELRCKGIAGVGVCSRTLLSFVFVCVSVYAGVHVYAHVYMRVCMCAWVCVCMCTCSHEYYLDGPCVEREYRVG
jgi:hypothetical protein